MCPNTKKRKEAKRPEPPQLAPYDVKEQLYSELLRDLRAPHPIFKSEPRGSSFWPFVSVITFFQAIPKACDQLPELP